MNHRVVITGIGVVSPMGNNLSEFWNGCIKGENIVTHIPSFWKKFYDYKSIYWAELKLPNYKELGLSSFQISKTDPAALNSLVAVAEALNDSQLNVDFLGKQGNKICDYNDEEIATYVGTGVSGISSFIDSYTHHSNFDLYSELEDLDEKIPQDLSLDFANIKEKLKFGNKFNPFVVAMYMPNTSAANIGITYNTKGGANTYSYACASSTISIGEAYSAIANGQIKCAIAGGTEFLRDEYGAIFRSFDQAGTLTRHTKSGSTCNRPFDSQRSGFLFSEGASCFLILENFNCANDRNAPIYAEIKGYEKAFEGHSMMAMEPSGGNLSFMMEGLLNNSKIKPGSIDYINAHGTGTTANDDIESKAIQSFFSRDIYVNSSKSLLGHSLGASGALEAAITALSIKNSCIHPSLNVEEPINDINIVTKKTNTNIDLAISQSFAFGGHNSALLLSKI